MKVVIYNDTSYAFNRIHFGCRLVMQSLRAALDDYQIIGTVTLDDARSGNWDIRTLREADLVIANGEGSFHHNRRDDFVRLAKRFPTALINTVYDCNRYTTNELKLFKYISARESASANQIKVQGVSCDVVPDLIFNAPYIQNVRASEFGGDITVDHYRNTSTMQSEDVVVPQIASALTVKTGSFHAACLAMYFDKPLGLWRSNSIKNNGLALDAGFECYDSEASTMVGGYDCDYVDNAQHAIDAMIEGLRYRV